MLHMKKTQIVRVLTAVRQGATTSVEAAGATGLPVKHCTSYMRDLEHHGLIKRVGKRQYHPKGGPLAIEYQLVSKCQESAR